MVKVRICPVVLHSTDGTVQVDWTLIVPPGFSLRTEYPEYPAEVFLRSFPDVTPGVNALTVGRYDERRTKQKIGMPILQIQDTRLVYDIKSVFGLEL